MGLWHTELVVLVCDETGKPNWLPIALFAFESYVLPKNWEFALVDGLAASGGESGNGWVAKWGYTELVRDPSHSDRLVERDPAALRIFFQELDRLSRKTRVTPEAQL